MGNARSSPDGILTLSDQIRTNDPFLTELVLADPLQPEQEVAKLIQHLPQNTRIDAIIFFDRFTAQVLRLALWSSCMESLIQLKHLQQVELLETQVPLWSISRLLWAPNLRALAIHDGIALATVTQQGIQEVADAVTSNENFQIREFVWECQFHSLSDGEFNISLDPLLFAFGRIPLRLFGLVGSLPPPHHLPEGSITSQEPLVSIPLLNYYSTQSHSSLESLALAGLGLTDIHVHQLTITLSAPTSSAPSRLRALHLQGNPLTQVGLQSLLTFLQETPTIHRLAIDESIANSELSSVPHWLFLNKYVREPLGTRPTLGLLHAKMVALRSFPNVIYYLLQSYPELYLAP